MPKKAPVLTCTEEDRAALDRWTIEARLVERANIIMKCIQGQSVLQIAKDLKIRPNTVIDRRRRFQRGGIAGLHDLPRSGKPPIYGKEFRNKVSETLEQSPPAGQAVWAGKHSGEQRGFKNTEELRKAIEAFVNAYRKTAKPFVWRKREVRGSQLRNTIANLRNQALASLKGIT